MELLPERQKSDAAEIRRALAGGFQSSVDLDVPDDIQVFTAHL
jgi:hypothetical protein